MRSGLVTLSLFASVALAGSIKDLDTKNGFRDLTFGASSKSVSGLTKMADDKKGKEVYARETDRHAIGGATLSQILYFFYKDQFYSVALKADDAANSDALFNAIGETYGDPTYCNKSISNCSWNGKKVRAGFNLNVITNESEVMIGSESIMEQMSKDQAAAAKRAAGDL